MKISEFLYPVQYLATAVTITLGVTFMLADMGKHTNDTNKTVRIAELEVEKANAIVYGLKNLIQPQSGPPVTGPFADGGDR